MALTPALVSQTWAGRPVTSRCSQSTPSCAVMMKGKGSGMRQASARYPVGHQRPPTLLCARHDPCSLCDEPRPADPACSVTRFETLESTPLSSRRGRKGASRDTPKGLGRPIEAVQDIGSLAGVLSGFPPLCGPRRLCYPLFISSWFQPASCLRHGILPCCHGAAMALQRRPGGVGPALGWVGTRTCTSAATDTATPLTT